MPVVGSSAYNTAGQITSLVRSLLNDSQGNLFTDAVLLPYANSAYRKLQRALGNAGGGGFIQDDVLLVVTAITQTDTSLQVAITDATAPVLVRNSQEALAYATAALAAWARGSPLAAKWDDAASDAIEDLVAAAVRREQQSARRRRPFSARSGYTP